MFTLGNPQFTQNLQLRSSNIQPFLPKDKRDTYCRTTMVESNYRAHVGEVGQGLPHDVNLPLPMAIAAVITPYPNRSYTSGCTQKT